ncbi:FliM/FliN family flagellar motor switch protein [Amaricoccus macauensis]|uniref:FliM/FliN family flagellar motor switch protein n=1 Tax=Amaricoccus macauensis TaxID=57001 RepID=UPI003C7C3F57
MSITENLLKRKLQQGGVARSPLPEPDFIGETFARQLEEGFRPLVKTMVSAMVLECKIIKLADAIQDISVPTMLGLAEVEDTKAQGLLAVDTDLAYHLIDLMLGGDHASAPVPITRSFTSIDMALCRLPLEALANAFMGAVASCFGRPVTRSLDIVGQRQDITQVRIAPDYVDVLVYNIALDIGEAARAGNLQLVLPLATLDAIRAAVQDEVPDEHASQAQDLWKIQMRRAAVTSPVVINAVLHRKKLTIAALEALKPGDVLEIPASAPDNVGLMVSQPGEKTAQIAAGKLGIFQGNKVVKLDEAVDRRVHEQLKPLL